MRGIEKKETVFVISNEPWGEIWYSKQHYANELAKLNHQVYFVNPVLNWKLGHLFSLALTKQEINSHLTVINYVNHFPLRIFPKFFQQINDWILAAKLSKLSLPGESLIWQFDPTRLIFLYFFSSEKRIYHLVDPMDLFWGDLRIAKASKLLVIIQRKFIQRYQEINSRIIHIPHGVSQDEFILDDTKLLQSIQSKYEGCILFIGTINRDVDLNLLLSTAKKFPQQPLLLIGPYAKPEPDTQKPLFLDLLDLTNVHHIKQVDARCLKYYISSAKVCLVPYNSKQQAFKRTPLKIINYLTQGKPIISTVGLAELNEKAVYHAQSAEEFLHFVELALMDKLCIETHQVHSYLRQIQYPNLIQEILKIFSD